MGKLIYFYSMIYQRLLKGIDGGKVLDVACGTGQFIEILSGSLGSFGSITGVDVLEESLAEARMNFPGTEYDFLQASSQDLPFEEGSFDLVTMSKALHHVEDPRASLDEMMRVLRTGGYLLINEMHRNGLNPGQESHMLYHHLRSEVDNALGISHNHTFHREELLNLAEGLGLQDRVITEFSPDDSRAKDPENIEEFIQKMYGWLDSLDGHPAKPGFESRITELEKRFRQKGISRPPQMVILGRKPEQN